MSAYDLSFSVHCQPKLLPGSKHPSVATAEYQAINGLMSCSCCSIVARYDNLPLGHPFELALSVAAVFAVVGEGGKVVRSHVW
jgi:hypothetical protein